MQICCTDLTLMTTPIIEMAVLSLGSNHQSQVSFDDGLIKLSQLGKPLLSEIIASVDYTQKTNSIYHNACMLLTLDKWWDFCQLRSQIKQIECLCGTSPTLKQQGIVPMDIDVLAVKVGEYWHLSQRRLPFKAHELVGLERIVPFLYDFYVNLSH